MYILVREMRSSKTESLGNKNRDSEIVYDGSTNMPK